jgi:hypothetical protein
VNAYKIADCKSAIIGSTPIDASADPSGVITAKSAYAQAYTPSPTGLLQIGAGRFSFMLLVSRASKFATVTLQLKIGSYKMCSSKINSMRLLNDHQFRLPEMWQEDQST